MSVCTLCPRSCGVDRETGTGYCGMPHEAVVARAALHYGEEPIVGGEAGSGAVFFSGCSLQCVFCQNFDLSRGRVGKKISSQRLAEIFRELEEKGAKNIDLVNPTHFQPAIVEALSLYKPKVPVLWNSSGYECAERIAELLQHSRLEPVNRHLLLHQVSMRDYAWHLKLCVFFTTSKVSHCIFPYPVVFTPCLLLNRRPYRALVQSASLQTLPSS